MKIKEVQLTRFKRFTNLKIIDIPETAKLIVLVGPNGSGKTSLFEAFNYWYKMEGFRNGGSHDYLGKNDAEETSLIQHYTVKMEFHKFQYTQQQIKSKFYFRTAYRNEPDFTIDNLNRQDDPTKYIRFQNLIVNDQTVSENYKRLVSQTLAGIYDKSNNKKNIESYREELIGKIRDVLSNIFEDLILNSIGDPLSNGSFYFEKGSSKNFHYKNLSAGEKSAFDLVLDMIIKSDFYSDTIFCIDEPEAHMHTRLQSKVLRELYNLISNNSQLWISTHSIGMLKEAKEIEEKNPGTVVFLDFDNKDFDLDQIMKPTKINRAIWARFFGLALADFSNLISPQEIVFCEGNPKGRKYKDFDAIIYEKILGEKHHDTIFVSIGSCSEIENGENQSINVISQTLKSSTIIKFIDRDSRTDEEVAELLEKGIRTSSLRHIENYLLDDEIIRKLCVQLGKEEHIDKCLKAKENAIQDSISRKNPSNDIKSASGDIYNQISDILDIRKCGSHSGAFLRDIMVPLITEETEVYKLIEKDIFG